jgi:hypothetical protein
MEKGCDNLYFGGKIKIMKRILITLLSIVSLLQSLHAGAIRISFLTDDVSLQDTLNFFRDNGCKEDSLVAFQKAVENYNSTFSNFDFSKFPKSANGFYQFQSATQLVSALPYRLSNTPHSFTFNCFDTVIVLAGEKFHTNLHPDDSGIFLPALTSTNGELWYIQAATAREAFDFSVPKWYFDMSKNYIPTSMADARINLIPALYCFHKLPASTSDKNIGDKVLDALQTSWKSQTIEFPSNFQIVLCHEVSLTNPVFVTQHAGLLFKHDKNYTYIEKNGGCGPFVRLDFEDKSDLEIWLSGMFAPKAQNYVFVTFNDSKIEKLLVP